MAERFLAEQRADLAGKAWELRVRRGWTQARIAKRLGTTQATVSRWLAHYTRLAHERLADEAQHRLAVEAELLDGLVEKALDGWFRSCKPRLSIKAKRKSGPDGTETEFVAGREGQNGDPRFLVAAMAALKQLRECLGYYAPEENEDLGKALDPDDLRRQLERLRLLGREGPGDDPPPAEG